MHAVHPNARTTPAVRADIARPSEFAGVPATRHDVSTKTVRKERKRGRAGRQDPSARPRKRPCRTFEDERAIARACCRATGFPVDDLTFVVRLGKTRGPWTGGGPVER